MNCSFVLRAYFCTADKQTDKMIIIEPIKENKVGTSLKNNICHKNENKITVLLVSEITFGSSYFRDVVRKY